MGDGGFSFLDTPTNGMNASRETTPAVGMGMGMGVGAETMEERGEEGEGMEKELIVDEPIIKNFYCSLEDL